MTAPIALSLVDQNEQWDHEIVRLREWFGAPYNPILFPQHFLSASFPKLGGQLVRFTQGADLLAVASLFPRGLRQGQRLYTLRFYPVQPDDQGAWVRPLLPAVGELLGGAKVVFYDPRMPHQFNRNSTPVIEGIEIGAPDAVEAETIRRLQETIWGAHEDALYPADLHSPGFGAGTTLVARSGGDLVGFLFGFYRFGGSPLPPSWDAQYGGQLRLESQLLGVLPGVRRKGVGFLLKRAQAFDAQRQGIGIVNWTVDPLQFSNAVLNFGRLKALSFDFYPAHYSFRNDLNQVAASRLGMTWLVQTPHVQEGLRLSGRSQIADLRASPDVPRTNHGAHLLSLDLTAPTIAIEIPGNWTALQREHLALAHQWRATTDQIFAAYLGCAPGQYALTAVATADEQHFLLAQRVTPEFLATFGTQVD